MGLIFWVGIFTTPPRVFNSVDVWSSSFLAVLCQGCSCQERETCHQLNFTARMYLVKFRVNTVKPGGLWTGALARAEYVLCCCTFFFSTANAVHGDRAGV